MKINSCLVHTKLHPAITVAEVEQLCNEAIQHDFIAVCIPPLFVKKVKTILKDSPIKVATVIGFPFGYSAIEAKVAETVLAIIDGADELQVVINISAIKNNDWQFLAAELNALLPIVKNKQKALTIIIESGLLTDDEIIKCCDLYGIAGVDFIKTSTGFYETAAGIETLQLIRKYLADKINIITGGDIKNYTFAKQLADAGADRLSCDAMQIVNEAIQKK